MLPFWYIWNMKKELKKLFLEESPKLPDIVAISLVALGIAISWAVYMW